MTRTKTAKTLSPLASLAAAATRAAAVAPRRAAAPILTHARVTIPAPGDLIIEATDCDLYTSETVTGLDRSHPQPGAPCQVCVDARALAQACKAAAKLNDGRLVIERDDAHIVRLRVGPTLLFTRDAADYPPAPAVADNGVYVGMAAWPTALAAVRPCVSTEETRYYLNGVAVISRSDGGVDVVATDGHRLAAYHAAYATLSHADMVGPGENQAASMSVHAIIPNAALDALADAVLLYVTSQHVRACIGSRLIVSKLIDATFPDYRRVIPPTRSGESRLPVYSASCDVKSLSAAAALAKQIGGKSAPVAWENASLRVKTGDDVSSTIPCSGAASPLTAAIGFNSTYLAALDAAFEAAGDTVPSVYMTDHKSPALWQGGSLRYVVMPMRV